MPVRRFRFLALAVFAAIALFLFTRSTSTYENYKSYAEEKYENVVGGGAVLRPDEKEEQTKEQPHEAAGPPKEEVVPAPKTTHPATTPSQIVVEFVSQTAPGSEKKVLSVATLAPTQPLPLEYQPALAPILNEDEIPIELGQGRFEADGLPPVEIQIHWTKQPEHFPVTSTIQLPTNKASSIPKIQHKFSKSSNNGADTDRLAVIKAAAEHTWRGYREHAWGHDEIKPVSGKSGDPFNGWGATLVDGLDTLWIMGMTAEFEEAVKFVETIDFTTSPRSDIPLFETTIRYLGGLIAAYEVSDAKYRALLDKAVELGEILYSAFDTPNRMPETYYRWKPTFSSNPHRASTRVVLAELGSLSMEFTRLAQLSGEPKYYDAIARITDALEEYQNNTRLSGMWPTYIDASGCAKPAQMNRPVYGTQLNHPDGSGNIMIADTPVQGGQIWEPPAVSPGKAAHEIIKEGEVEAAAAKEQSGIAGEVNGFEHPKEEDRWTDKKQQKRQDDTVKVEAQPKPEGNDDIPKTSGEPNFQKQDNTPKPQTGADVCIPQGLGSPSKYGSETYTLAGMSDSTYEYLPKMHLLLSGRVEQYKKMYLKTADVAIERLIYKPMVKDGRDILASGDLSVAINSSSETGELIETFKAVNSHLVCFAGGMFALGGVIFDRPEDIGVGKKLTDGCIWAYNVTATGIMPEDFYLSKCESKTNCEWNETKYYEELDPYRSHRAKTPTILGTYGNDDKDASDASGAPAALKGTDYVDTNKRQAEPEAPAKASEGKLAEPVNDAALPTLTGTRTTDVEVGVPAPPIPKLSALKPIYTPPVPLTHEEYVAKKIEEERLPPGFTSITSKNYILRPEAIESVFYMYRITGDQYWRDRGWEMFTAVQAHTSTVLGYSAIDDVTKAAPELKDSEESFWLAETLKYFYLLFDEPDKWSLDDWVLNTEAHFFKRT